MRVPVINSDEDMEIINLKSRVKFGGNIYEEKYSYWARLIPTDIKDKFEHIKKKRVEELSLDEQQFLIRYYEFLQFASLQTKVDEETITKPEYIEYLMIRCNWPLEKLRKIKLSETDHTILERYLKEVSEEKSYKQHIDQLNKKIQYRMNELDSVHSASYELAKRRRLI